MGSQPTHRHAAAAAGRSCFQVVDMRRYEPAAPMTAVDIAAVRDLDVSAALVAEYEPLVRGLGAWPGSIPARALSLRKPPAKLSGRPAASLPSPPGWGGVGLAIR
jgi:hypothetical protein